MQDKRNHLSDAWQPQIIKDNKPIVGKQPVDKKEIKHNKIEQMTAIDKGKVQRGLAGIQFRQNLKGGLWVKLQIIA